MKAPLISQHERYILKMGNSQLGNIEGIELRLAVARLKQAFGKTYLIQKLVKPLVEWLAKLLESLHK